MALNSTTEYYRYKAEHGRVYVVYGDGRVEEAATALTASGRDLELHDLALQRARVQREQNLAEYRAAFEWTNKKGD